MESLAKLHHTYKPLQLSLNHHRPSFPNPISSLRSFPSSHRSLSIRASSSSPSPLPRNPKPSSPFLTTACTAIAAAAFFLGRFHGGGAAIAAPVASPPPAVEQETADAEERELVGKTSDVDALRTLVEEKIKANKLGQAVEILERLVVLEPEELEWPLLRANIHSYMENYDLAMDEFEEVLKKDPLRVEAYHGLVMAAASQADEDVDEGKMKGLMSRVEEAMRRCESQRNKSEVRDFKLLIAQIRVMESKYNDALKLYQELVKDEPRDFRPYLCQGIIYTLLKKNKEAQQQFDTFRRLVPKNHPFRDYFEENMFATKLFPSIDRETVGSRG